MLENLHTILAIDVLALAGIATTALTIWKRHVSPLIKRNTEREKWEASITKEVAGLAKGQAASAASVNDRLTKEIELVDRKLTKHENADHKMIDKLDAMNERLHEVHRLVAVLEAKAEK